MKKIFLDARELEHPEPLQKAIEALGQLDEDSLFYMLHRKNPIPLIEIAKGRGFTVFYKESKEGEWHILITKNQNLDLSKYLNV